MGDRDYSHREEKKSKKEAKNTKVETLTPSPETEVVKKGKTRKGKVS
ncbi:MAG: hypothetical protein HW388_479 [Dehalococcoidia bacterium]|nr:hypothetical protein [Dehalococcoidia bacterium]